MCKSLILAIVFIGVFTLPSGAAPAVPNWSGNVKIASIEISNVNTPGVWLSFASAPYSSHTCSAKNGQYMLGGNDPNIIRGMESIATAALVNSRNVSVFWSGNCSGGGTTGYPILIGVTLK